jgi:hypothetical protein
MSRVVSFFDQSGGQDERLPTNLAILSAIFSSIFKISVRCNDASSFLTCNQIKIEKFSTTEKRRKRGRYNRT